MSEIEYTYKLKNIVVDEDENELIETLTLPISFG
jgi:hypothetical protein